MMNRLFLCVIVVAVFAIPGLSDDGVRRVLRIADSGTSLLDATKFRNNGKDFVKSDENTFVCDNGSDATRRSGVSQFVVLNQKVAAPIIASAWSKAENVSGDPDSNYSVYLDLTYADGTNLWGQATPFPTGTQDWNRREIVVFPDKPVKSVSFYTLFRNHSGKASFRDLELQAPEVPEGACMFDGVPIIADKQRGPSPKLLLRDVATNGDFLDAEKFTLGLEIRKSAVSPSVVEYTLESRDDADHILTAVYTVPVARKDLRFCEHPRKSVPVSEQGEFSLTSGCGAGFSGRVSRYPFAAVAGTEKGTALGIDMLHPCIYRATYNAGTEELFIACDIALTKEKKTATLRFCRFGFNPQQEFRGALAEYYKLFPECFRCRTPQQGIWMPFAKISKLDRFEDFGFKFKEGIDETAWDDAHDILTFRYTEPTTWWMSIPKELPRTMDVALAQVAIFAGQGNPSAKILASSGFRDCDGNLTGKFLDRPWGNGIVWSINEIPGLPQPNGFGVNWNADIFEKMYGPNRKGDLDGEYVDSAECYVTAQLDFARDHFSACKRPLTFDKETRQPGIYRGLIVQEYVEKLAADMHAAGKLTMANSTPGAYCWLAPHFDVLGTETNWNPGGKWRPMSDAELLYKRAICGPKPYCFLMNTKFSEFPYELTQRFMKRCLAYGMFPGFFSEDASSGHYFSRPELYDRDRPLFKKYVPLCKMVAEAGWNPIPGATSSDPSVYVERFGNYLTIFNDSKEQKTATITLESPAVSLKEHVRGGLIGVVDNKFEVVLAPEDVLVVEKPQ